MVFILVLMVTTFCIAASAAFFSVFGLMQTYSAIAIPILIMGASLELGKLVTASALYRMWNDFSGYLRFYLLLAVAGLMLMTSLGIFGYLTAGYQKDSVPMEQITQKLDYDKAEIARLIARKAEIDQQIAKLPNNYVSSRQKLMESFGPELKSIGPRIDELQKEIGEYQTKKIDTEAHIGPIIFVAKIFGRSPDESVFWFTLLIMSVFDPLAIALTLATNIAIEKRKQNKNIATVLEVPPPPVEQDYNSKEYAAEAVAPIVEDIPVTKEPIDTNNPLTKEDVIEIVQAAVKNDDAESLQKRKEILNALR